MSKGGIRRELKADPGDANFDAAISTYLLDTAEWRKARSVLIYVSVANEPSTRGIIEHSWSAGKTVAAPVADFATREMAFRQFGRWDELTETNGLFQPIRGAEHHPDGNDIIIVPAVAFDPNTLCRVGHGGGFYDRFLSKRSDLTAIGLTYERRLRSFAAEPHDEPVDILITEKGVRKPVGK